jgi:hypothetical protein
MEVGYALEMMYCRTLLSRPSNFRGTLCILKRGQKLQLLAVFCFDVFPPHSHCRFRFYMLGPRLYEWHFLIPILKYNWTHLSQKLTAIPTPKESLRYVAVFGTQNPLWLSAFW